MSNGLRLQRVPTAIRETTGGTNPQTAVEDLSEQTRRLCDLTQSAPTPPPSTITPGLPPPEAAPCVPGACSRQDELARLAEELETRNEQMQILLTEFSILKTEQDASAARLDALEKAYRAVLAELQDVRAGGAEPAVRGVPGEAPPAAGETAEHLVLHVEADPRLRGVVETAAARVRAYCCDPPNAFGLSVPGRSLLVVNLLAEGDPLSLIFNASVWGFPHPTALAYLANEGHGAVLGVVEFCPPNMEAEQCVARVLARPTRPRRVLIVSEDFPTTTPIHEWLTLRGCAVSAALDYRDALTVMPVFKPDLMLVDLALPNGGALRLSAHLRTMPATSNLPLMFLCSKRLPPEEFRGQGVATVEKFTLSTSDLARAIESEFAAR